MRLEATETEVRRTENGVALNAFPERVLVSVEDEVPDRNGVLSEASADLAPVLLDQVG